MDIRQHDASEYLRHVIDLLDQDLNRFSNERADILSSEEKEKLSFIERARLELKYVKSKCSSVVSDPLVGIEESILQCNHCGFQQAKYDKFTSISIPIPAGMKKVDLQDCFDAYFENEELECWHCHRCDTNRAATKKLAITKLPEKLIVELRRFSYDYDKNRTVKLSKNVTFPVNGLDLSKYMSATRLDEERKPTFDLRGTVDHIQSSKKVSDCGHYVAQIEYSGKWLLKDDSRAPLALKEEQLKGPKVYLLIYSLRK
jgi:ubiquitin C-terminal hydrolase